MECVLVLLVMFTASSEVNVEIEAPTSKIGTVAKVVHSKAFAKTITVVAWSLVCLQGLASAYLIFFVMFNASAVWSLAMISLMHVVVELLADNATLMVRAFALFFYISIVSVWFFTMVRKVQHKKTFACMIAASCLAGLGICAICAITSSKLEKVVHLTGPLVEETTKFIFTAAVIKIYSFLTKQEPQTHAFEFSLAIGSALDMMEFFGCVRSAENNFDAFTDFLAHLSFKQTLLNLSPFFFFQNPKETFWSNTRAGLKYSIKAHYVSDLVLFLLLDLFSWESIFLSQSWGFLFLSQYIDVIFIVFVKYPLDFFVFYKHPLSLQQNKTD